MSTPRAKFQLENVDDIEATLTITMKIGEWRTLRGQISEKVWPSWKFSEQIHDMIFMAESKFFAQEERK